MIKPAARRIPLPLIGACALVLLGGVAHSNARAGDAPLPGPVIGQYLELHDEATRMGALGGESAPRATGEDCVRQVEQPRANRQEVRG
jgi:hypothetical protein